MLRSNAVHASIGWRRGVVVNVVRRMNKVTHTSGPVSTGMGDRLRAGIPSRYVTDYETFRAPPLISKRTIRIPDEGGRSCPSVRFHSIF